jgi:hypothetical protein
MAKDLLLDDNGDLMIQNNDFVVGDSTYQDIKLVIQSAPGEWRPFPTIGVNATNYLKSPDASKDGLLNEIKKQVKAIGIPLKSVYIDGNGDIKVDVR